jgi:hypothetical protein
MRPSCLILFAMPLGKETARAKHVFDVPRLYATQGLITISGHAQSLFKQPGAIRDPIWKFARGL